MLFLEDLRDFLLFESVWWMEQNHCRLVKSGENEAVIGQTLELLMSDVRVVAGFMECFANALNWSGFCRFFHLFE